MGKPVDAADRDARVRFGLRGGPWRERQPPRDLATQPGRGCRCWRTFLVAIRVVRRSGSMGRASRVVFGRRGCGRVGCGRVDVAAHGAASGSSVAAAAFCVRAADPQAGDALAGAHGGAAALCTAQAPAERAATGCHTPTTTCVGKGNAAARMPYRSARRSDGVTCGWPAAETLRQVPGWRRPGLRRCEDAHAARGAAEPCASPSRSRPGTVGVGGSAGLPHGTSEPVRANGAEAAGCGVALDDSAGGGGVWPTRCRNIKLERGPAGPALTKPDGFYVCGQYARFGAQMSTSFQRKSKNDRIPSLAANSSRLVS